jgi:hypothetical protein
MPTDFGSSRAASVNASTDATTFLLRRVVAMSEAASPSLTRTSTRPVPSPE